ncbi:MAG: hypothetical protein J6S23_01715 [Clostridia bacterium]|nr:hypothetical protein [Clostridia bacterium]
MKILTKADAIAFRKQIEAAAIHLDDKAASESPDFYEHMKYDGKAISAGTRINFEGVLYKAAVTLWDTEENNPHFAPSLWEKINYHNGVRVIPEVITVTTAFSKDELGYWEADGKIYKSLLNANVYTPVAYPQGWEEVK